MWIKTHGSGNKQALFGPTLEWVFRTCKAVKLQTGPHEKARKIKIESESRLHRLPRGNWPTRQHTQITPQLYIPPFVSHRGRKKVSLSRPLASQNAFTPHVCRCATLIAFLCLWIFPFDSQWKAAKSSSNFLQPSRPSSRRRRWQ